MPRARHRLGPTLVQPATTYPSSIVCGSRPRRTGPPWPLHLSQLSPLYQLWTFPALQEDDLEISRRPGDSQSKHSRSYRDMRLPQDWKCRAFWLKPKRPDQDQRCDLPGRTRPSCQMSGPLMSPSFIILNVFSKLGSVSSRVRTAQKQVSQFWSWFCQPKNKYVITHTFGRIKLGIKKWSVA